MASKKQSLDRDIIRYYWRATTRYKKEFLLSWFIPINAICSNTIAPFIVGKLLASLLLPNQQVKGYVIAFIITGIATYITNWIGFWGYMRSQAQTITDLQASTLQMLLRRGTAFHNNQVSGRLVTEALDFPSAYMQLATTFFTNVIPYVVALVSGIAIIAVSSPLLGLVVLVMTVVALGSGYRLRISMKPFREERIRRQKEVTAHFADTIVNIQAVKTFAREDEELASHKAKGKQLENIRIKNWVSFSRSGTQRVGIAYLFQLTFILTLITLVHRDPAILGAGIFAFTYTVTLTNRLFDITSIMRTFEEALVQAEPMMRAMQTTPEISDEPGAPALIASSGEVSFRDVGFQYSDTDSNEKVFEGLQLHIKAGEKLGLVGPSGGGKSTITKLLLRFEDVQEGAIEIDGQNIASVTQQSLRRAIAYVPQESLLFHRTIEENIAYGHLPSSHEAVVRAAKQAYAHDFIMGLPNGYDTIVGERGVKLSGGQRQRIAIARAMLKDSPIILLDEATSALDSESEKVIQEALKELLERRTAIVIAHRLSTIQRMDRIVVLDKGKIVEDGTHAALLKKKGLYAALWAHQSGGFLED